MARVAPLADRPLSVLATLALLALVLVVLPPLLVPAGNHSLAELAKAESDIRGNLVAALGVLAVLIGAVVGSSTIGRRHSKTDWLDSRIASSWS